MFDLRWVARVFWQITPNAWWLPGVGGLDGEGEGEVRRCVCRGGGGCR